MKQRTTPARSPRKLAINKDQLRGLPQNELANVNGGAQAAPTDPRRTDAIGSWY